MDLKTLYRDVILDHYKHPRNATALADASVEARCKNPSCGDRVTLQLRFDGERVDGVACIGNGCAISMASASMLTQALKGRTAGEAAALSAEFRRMIVDGAAQPDPAVLGDLVALQGIARLHARVKCAMCGWSALDAALQGESGADAAVAEIDLSADHSMPESSAGES